MARKAQRSASSGAPGITNGIGVALNPIGLQQVHKMPYGNFLDPTVALEQVPHPSAKWAGVELDPIRPRR